MQDAVAKLQDEQDLSSVQQASTSASTDHSDPLTSSSSSTSTSTSAKPKQKSKQLALIAGSIKTKRKRYVITLHTTNKSKTELWSAMIVHYNCRSQSSQSGEEDVKSNTLQPCDEKDASHEKKQKLDPEAMTG